MCMAPVGYKNKTSDTGRKYITLDETAGPILRWAFTEIASATFTTESILKKCREKGLICSKNNFWNALRNPVYYGKIKIKAWKTEDVQLVQGQHAPLISEDLFYNVQDVLDGRKKIQRTKITVDDKFPLRGFLLCPDCGKVLTASSSKGRKQYYDYYHCESKCGVRFSAEEANKKFIGQLQSWKPHPAVQVLYKIIIDEVYQQDEKNKNAELRKIKQEMKLLSARHNKARELLMNDTMEGDDYKTIKKECERRTCQLEARWSELASVQVDLQPMMDKAMRLLGALDEVYTAADTSNKRDIIGSMFPEKLVFTGEAYRTARINEAVRLIYSLGNSFGEIKKGQQIEKSMLSQEVIRLGLEPRTHTLKVYCSTN